MKKTQMPAFNGRRDLPPIGPQVGATGDTYDVSITVTGGKPVGLADLVFTAPPSGRALLQMGVYLRSNTAGQATTLTPEVREGGTLRAGTLFYPASQLDDGIGNYNTAYVRGWAVVYLTGLTPGATYNAYPVVGCGAAGATWTLGKCKVTDLP